MNPLEQILLDFAKKQLATNPQFVTNLLQHLLEKKNLDPKVISAVIELANDLIPILIQNIK